MIVSQTRHGQRLRVEFGGAYTVMPVFFLGCGAAAMLLIFQKLTAGDASLIETVVLSVTMTYVGMLMAISAEEIMPVVMVLDPQGITVERAFTVERIVWTDIDRIDLTGTSGRLADGVSVQAAGRIGLAIFKVRTDRAAASGDPETVVFSAPASSAEAMLKVCTDVTTYRRHLEATRRLSTSNLGLSSLAARTFGARA